MNKQTQRKIRREVAREFQFNRAGLFRLEKEQELRSQIAEDRERLFRVFKERLSSDGSELANCLKRLVMNFSALSSYRGIVKGHSVFKLGISLGEKKADQYIIRYLSRHPDATDKELCSYLDDTNDRLYRLNRTNKEGPLWARTPPKWLPEIRKKDSNVGFGNTWSRALTYLPGRVMTYLSRARKMAHDKAVQEALFLWPRVLREHRKRRTKIAKD
jgi:hypothetical protein